MRPRPADAAIILGAHTDGYRPSRPLRARLRGGLDVYRRGLVSHIIVSGGRGADETVTESSSMKRFLVFNGVPPDAVLEERRSRDTWENLRNSQELVELHQWRTVVIVTSDYHLFRALAVARRLGMSATGMPVPSGRREFVYAVREVGAIFTYLLAGRLKWR
ncbi:MAG: YdcF family protein [Alicyclobacillaceae bacterium]|nr:YdcF family protein [Alicyclobacillaceae bacterium]